MAAVISFQRYGTAADDRGVLGLWQSFDKALLTMRLGLIGLWQSFDSAWG